MNGPEIAVPAPVVAAAAALQASMNDLHVMHECDENCDIDCDSDDQSPDAYRRHDEHNFDTREAIEDRAGTLLDALEDWLGPISQVSKHEEARAPSPVKEARG